MVARPMKLEFPTFKFESRPIILAWPMHESAPIEAPRAINFERLSAIFISAGNVRARFAQALKNSFENSGGRLRFVQR